MGTLIADGREVTFTEEETLLEVFNKTGFKIPQMCFLAGLTPNGRCGLCTVELQSAPDWVPILACAIRPQEGMVVRTQSERITMIRTLAAQLLLRSHPCDCDYCEHFGDCELRRVYNKTGFGFTRAIEDGKKQKPYLAPLSDRLLLDREKCTSCGLCVSFFREELEEDFVHFIREKNDHLRLERYPHTNTENGYLLNAIEVCPCHALFDQQALSALPSWKLHTVSGISTESSAGNNIYLCAHDGEIAYVKPRPNSQVNRYIPDSVRNLYRDNDKNRIDKVLFHGQPIDLREALTKFLKMVGFGHRCAMVARASLSLESLFLIRQLADILGAPVFFKKHPQEGDGWLISKDADTNVRGTLLTRAIKKEQIEDFQEIETLIDNRQIQTLIVLENDLLAEGFPKKAFEKVESVIFASHKNTTTPHGHLIFPLTTVVEEDGHLINQNFLLQRYHRALIRPTEAQPLWQWLAMAKNSYLGNIGPQQEFQSIEAVWDALAKSIPEFVTIDFAKIPDKGITIDGQRFTNFPFCDRE